MKKETYKINERMLKNNGMTLIELMVVVAILSFIILGLVTFFTGGAKSWIAGQSQLKAQREARQAMERMVREIREGKEIVTGSVNSFTVKIPVFDTDGLLTGDYNNITYELENNVIKRENLPLIDDVKTFQITYPDNSKIHIILDIDVDEDNNPDITLDTDINLRNYGIGTNT